MARPTKAFEIRYRNAGDAASPVFRKRVHAYDVDHAQMQFDEASDAEGWEVLSIDRPRRTDGRVDYQHDLRAA